MFALRRSYRSSTGIESPLVEKRFVPLRASGPIRYTNAELMRLKNAYLSKRGKYMQKIIHIIEFIMQRSFQLQWLDKSAV